MPSGKPQLTGDVQQLPFGSQIVSAIQGRSVSTKIPATGSRYRWNGTLWEPDVKAWGKRTSNVTTAGTTFGTGADILATALTFTADGSSDYLVSVKAPNWSNSGAGQNQLRINLDGADVGVFAYLQVGTVLLVPLNSEGVIVAPSPGTHTLNVRVVVNAGTATITAGTGGSGLNSPALVAVSSI